MKRMMILAIALLAVSTPVWANTLLCPTSQIGLCNSYIMCGGCIPTPCPMSCLIPNPCSSMGNCQMLSCVATINTCLMSGPCGVIGMQNACAMTSQIGYNHCVPQAMIQCMAGMNMNGHCTVLNIGIP
jgi:hypothetical protein